MEEVGWEAHDGLPPGFYYPDRATYPHLHLTLWGQAAPPWQAAYLGWTTAPHQATVFIEGGELVRIPEGLPPDAVEVCDVIAFAQRACDDPADDADGGSIFDRTP